MYIMIVWILIIFCLALMVDFAVGALILTFFMIWVLRFYKGKISLTIMDKGNSQAIRRYKDEIKSAKKSVMHNDADKESNKTESNTKELALEEALKTALDIRKFEIELYWKRAGYFWGIMGFCSVSTALAPKFEEGSLIAFFLSCLALFISCGFWLANRGSKFWQENWESHVDLLEDDIIGPVYRNIFAKVGECKFSISNSWPFSVSRINMYLSFAFIIFWSIMIIYQLWIIADKMFCIHSNCIFSKALELFNLSADKFYFICILAILLLSIIGSTWIYVKTGSSEIENGLTINSDNNKSTGLKRTILTRKKWSDNQ